MRYLLLLLGIMLMGCGATQSNTDLNKNNGTGGAISSPQTRDTIRIANEELEYEIIILELGFESWLATQRPQSYYTQSTLEIKNLFYVTEWNNRVSQPFVYDPNLYMQPIDYRQGIDYGMEVNYLLYMYFQFFEQKYNQNLIPGR